MTPEQVELAVVLGNNLDKLQALEFMNKDQLTRVLTDLFNRPNPLFFYDTECEAKELGLPEYKSIRSKKVELVKVEGIFLVNKLIKMKKMPTKYGLVVLKQLETIEGDWEPWWRKISGKWVLSHINQMSGVEVYLSKQIIDQFTKKNAFPEIFKGNSKLFFQYQEDFLAKLKQTKNLAQLQNSTVSLLGLIDNETKQEFMPALTKFLTEKISAFATKDLLIFHKGERFKSRYLYDGDNEISDLFVQLVAAELPRKEHVIKPSQAKLIRQMSIHAGKKLTLREAQLLDNQLKKKK
jgi:hypothetical protein